MRDDGWRPSSCGGETRGRPTGKRHDIRAGGWAEASMQQNLDWGGGWDVVRDKLEGFRSGNGLGRGPLVASGWIVARWYSGFRASGAARHGGGGPAGKQPTIQWWTVKVLQTDIGAGRASMRAVSPGAPEQSGSLV
ncbi:hypothetical protein Tco_0162266 [Tanacetum coccineum]